MFAKEVIEKVQELDQEKMKTEKAFHDFLPLTIVRDIKLKKVLEYRKEYSFLPTDIQVSAENFDCVTIFFGDIVGFNDLTNDCSAIEAILTSHALCSKWNILSGFLELID